MDRTKREGLTSARTHLAIYRETGYLFSFTGLLQALDYHKVTPEELGITTEWLREQGSLLAQGAIHDVRGNREWGINDLVSMRDQLDVLGISREGWVITNEDIAAAYVRIAQDLYAKLIRNSWPSLYDGWCIFALWGEGRIPNLEVVGEDVRDLIVGAAIMWAKGHIRDAARTAEHSSTYELGLIMEFLPRLDEYTLGRLRAAGIPTDATVLERRKNVYDARDYWRRLHDKERDNRLTMACLCGQILVHKSCAPYEFGTSMADVKQFVVDWAGRQIMLIEAGDYSGLENLEYLNVHGETPFELMGVTLEQIAKWRLGRARLAWSQAREGTWSAALAVIMCAESEESSYDEVTGYAEVTVKPMLVKMVADYALDLILTIKENRGEKAARKAEDALDRVRHEVEQLNSAATDAGLPEVVDANSWMMTTEDSVALHFRYAY